MGEKGTLEASMIKRGRGQIYGLVFSKPYSSGSLLPPYLASLAMQIFFFFLFFLVLDLLGVFSCILRVLGSRLLRCASNEFPLLIQNKKVI